MSNIINELAKYNVFTSRLMFARFLLAFGAFLTLAFNNMNELTNLNIFDSSNNIELSKILIIKPISIFTIFGPTFGRYLSLLILLFVFTGYFPKLSSIFQAWVHLSIVSSFIIIEGGEQIASNLSILMIPLCVLDNRKNQWLDDQRVSVSSYTKTKNIFCAVYFFLIRIQMAIIYLQAATGKIYKDDWRDGTSLYFWVTHNVFGAPEELGPIYSFFTLSSMAPIFTWSIIILEFLLFACLLATDFRIRKLFLYLGMLFHLLIIPTHGLFTFFFSVAGGLILYLDSQNIIYSKVKEIRRYLHAKTI